MSDRDQPVDERAIRLHFLAQDARCIVYRYRLAPACGFEYVSPSVTPLTGYTAEEHYADPHLGLKLVHPDDHHALRQMVEGRLPTPVILRIVRKDGRIIWMEQRNRALFDARGQLTAIEGVALAITERRQAEEAIAAEARFLQAQTEVAAIALSNLQLDALGPKLLEAIARAQGYAYGALWRLTKSRKEAVVIATAGDKTAAYLGFRLKLSEPLPVVAQAIRTGRPTFCNQIQEKPLAEHPLCQILQPQALLALPLIHYRGDVVGAVSFGDARNPTRFTERDLAQGLILARQVARAIENSELSAQVQDLEERYQVVTESINDALYTIDLDGHVTSGNSALERLTGYRMEELLGQPAALFYASGSDVILKERGKRTMRGKSVHSHAEIEILRKDGGHVPAELSGANLVQQGKIVGRIAVLRDITERKRAAEQAERRRREAEVLAELARTLNASLDLDTVLVRVVDGAKELCHSDVAMIAIQDPSSEAMIMR